MFPTFQITNNVKYDGWSIGIYIVKDNEYNSFPNKPLIIQNSVDDIVEALYLRDLDFSFVTHDNTIIKLGLFLYNPQNIKMYMISDYYRKERVLPNISSIKNLGVYTYHFSSKIFDNIFHYDTNTKHLKFETMNDNNTNYVKFDLYCFKLEKEKDDLYYFSNPLIKIDLRNIE